MNAAGGCRERKLETNVSEQGAEPLRCCGYGDESRFNVGRYRSIALVSLEERHEDSLENKIRKMLDESDVTEFKWVKLNGAKERFAAIKLLSLLVDQAVDGRLRADVLIWDTMDKRHIVNRRDDIANLERMYYQLLKNVLRERWPDESLWAIFPDEHTSLDWNSIQQYLSRASFELEIEPKLFTGWNFRMTLRTEFKITKILPCESCDVPLIQVADLLAGLGAYSCQKYDTYEQWLRASSSQQELSFDVVKQECKLSGSDRERVQVLKEFDRMCKERALGVSLKTERGLRTFNPERPLNFWLYKPQSDKDKAPVKIED